MWWAYLLCAFGGGVAALAALAIAITTTSRRNGLMSITFGGDSPKQYDDLELLEHEVRPGGVYVRYRNNGRETSGSVSFRVKVYEPGDRLIAEVMVFTDEPVAPGGVGENILPAYELERSWVQDPANRIHVMLLHGWLPEGPAGHALVA
ncbi:hypothetical protein Pla123a_22110 [Posidoniimonas polymericola]|uniref:Uncharacterized protein n=1 Tax=Posidoniimonas polymericola TaxID=2528002 RepID=A0A5C5YS40_9BACT|nr:hypothetical protein Pla123a_22110 [Posidoniimonas polymericola]